MSALDTRDPSCNRSEKRLPNIPGETQCGCSDRIAPRYTGPALWLWELLGLLTSIICVASLLIILGKYDGKPVPVWSYGLTVNGVVSILAVVAKASMILPTAEAISQLKWHHFWQRTHLVMDFERFDSASRGPWGSLMLLCNPRSWNWATIGALLTLAALVLEPSLQQTVTFPLVEVPSGIAHTPRGIFFNKVDHDGLGNPVVSSQTRGALYAAIFNATPTNTTVINPNCPTGNCTWPTFQSLGVCNYYPDWSLPNGLDLEGLSDHWTAWMIGGIYSTVAYNPTWINQTIVDLSYIYVPPVNGSKAFNQTHPNAWECVLYPCVKTYEARMESGSYSDEVVDTWPPPNVTTPGNFDMGNMFACVGTGTGTSRTDCTYSLEGNFTLNPLGSSESFAMSLDFYNLFRCYIGYLLNLSFDSTYNGRAETSPIINDIPLAFYTAQFNGSIDQDSGKTLVWEILGPAVVKDNIAISLTNHLRNFASGSPLVEGTAVTVRNLVHARWWWATFVIVLLSLTTAFLLFTIALTIKRGVPVWKSSSLAPLLHGLDGDSCRSITEDRVDRMECNARSFQMAMVLKTDVWRMEGST